MPLYKNVPYIVVNRTDGAFYMTIVFNEAVLNDKQKLQIQNAPITAYVEQLAGGNIENDKRFVYYLLGATGICVVPLTSFFTSLPGFRLTLLEKDEGKFEKTIHTLAEKIVEYIESSK